MTRPPFRIRLRAGIALAFLLTTVPVIGIMLSYLHHQNSRSALEVAAQSIARTTRAITDDIEGLLSPVARVAEATAMFGRIDRSGLRRIESLRYFSDTLATLPQLASLYVGFAGDGAFFQLVGLGRDSGRFGPTAPFPPDAKMALRMLDNSSGTVADSYFYLRSWGQVVGVERGNADYDPRRQPWYQAARQSTAAVLSDAFVLPATGRPVVTVSYRVATDDGVSIGAVGADVSLDELARRLDTKRIGRSGVIFVIDGAGRVICHNRADLLVNRQGGEPSLLMASAFPDPVLAGAVAQREQGAGNRFIAPLGPHGQDYIVEFATLPNIGRDWTIGVAVEVDEFVGPIQAATARILVIGAVLLALSTLVLLWLSHRLTRPMRQIVAETNRIRTFDLDGTLEVRSRVREVAELAGAVEAMKGGLRQFGAYVPKALVRDMIVTGDGGTLGGEIRPLTILFTDIAGFTATSEAMPPQQVLDRLTTYFQRMTDCIHARGGTVDKFIGDAIMAFWNAPRTDPDHAENACLAALGCLVANRRINDAFAALGTPPMPTRFGLHMGEVIVGNVGSSDRMQYTALGSHVNLASRIEGLNKVYGTSILVTDTVERMARGRFLFRPVDLAVPSGLSAPIELFELLGALDPQSPFACSPDTLDGASRWNTVVVLYRARQWSAALDLLHPLARDTQMGGLARLYIDRCESLIANPPGDEWDGAEHYKTK